MFLLEVYGQYFKPFSLTLEKAPFIASPVLWGKYWESWILILANRSEEMAFFLWLLVKS